MSDDDGSEGLGRGGGGGGTGAFLAGSIVGKLLLDKLGWNQSVKSVSKDKELLESAMGGIAIKASEIGKQMAVVGGAIVGTLTAAAVHAGRVGGDFVHLSMKTGMSVETLGELKYAAELVDIPFETLARSANFLSRNVDDLIKGEGKAADAFAALGVSAKNQDGSIKNMDQLLMELADKFAELPDGMVRSGLAMDIFGKQGATMIPLLAKGSKGIAELRKEANDLGVVMSTKSAIAGHEYEEALKKVKASAEGLTLTLGTAAAPTLTAWAEKITKIQATVNAWMKQNPELAQTIAGVSLVVGKFLIITGGILMALPRLVAGFGLAKNALLSLNGAHVVAAAVFGFTIAKVTQLLGILVQLKAAKEYEKEATKRYEEANTQLKDKLHQLVIVGKLSEAQFAALTKKYNDNTAAMAMAIKKGREGVDLQKALAEIGAQNAKRLDVIAQAEKNAAEARERHRQAVEAAKKAEEDYTAFLASAGILKAEDRNKKLAESALYVSRLDAMLKKHLITNQQYHTALNVIIEELDKYGIATKTAMPPARNFNSIMEKGGKITEEDVYAFASFDEMLLQNAQTFNLASREVLALYLQMMRLQMLALGFPPNLIPNIDIARFTPQVEKVESVWKEAMGNIVSGFADAVTEGFTIVEALVGHATKHNQEYFDRAMSDIQKEADARRKLLEEEYTAAQKAIIDKYSQEEKALEQQYMDRRAAIIANVADENERIRQLKELESWYSDEQDKLRILGVEKEKQKAAELEALAEEEKQKEAQLEAWRAAEEERIRADEEKSREDHARAEEERQRSLWGKVVGIVDEAVKLIIKRYVVDWITNNLIPASGKAVEAIAGTGKAVSDLPGVVSTATTSLSTVLTTLATSIGTIITTLATAVATGITTVAGAIAGAIVTLATAIATAATTLAAAAPAILTVAAIGLGIFAVAKGISALFGGGGSKEEETLQAIYAKVSDIRAWTLNDQVFQMNELIFWEQQLCNSGTRMEDLTRDSQSIMRSQLDALNSISGTLANLKGAQQGAVSTSTELLVVHGRPDRPEFTLPADQLSGLVDRGGGGGGGRPIIVIIKLDTSETRIPLRSTVNEVVASFAGRMAKNEKILWHPKGVRAT